MRDDVRVCVEARVNFFGQFYDVPANVQHEVDAFIESVIALGERSSDAAAFEADFVSSGLSEQFNKILPKCSPKAVPVSAEYQEYTEKVQAEFKEERKKQFADTLINDVTESVTMQAESDAVQARRRAMSDAGVLDDYTRATNVIDDAGRAAGFFGRLFGRNKNQG